MKMRWRQYVRGSDKLSRVTWSGHRGPPIYQYLQTRYQSATLDHHLHHVFAFLPPPIAFHRDRAHVCLMLKFQTAKRGLSLWSRVPASQIAHLAARNGPETVHIQLVRTPVQRRT